MTRAAHDPTYGRTLALAPKPPRRRGAPVVLVHGAADAVAAWDALGGRLRGREVVALPLPAAGASAWALRDWLVSELEAMEGPVHAIGHGEGSPVVQAVVRARPELLRSWAVRAGTDDVEPLLALEHQERVLGLVASGMPVLPADRAARAMDGPARERLSALARTRSAVEVRAGAAVPPGLVLWGERDPGEAARALQRFWRGLEASSGGLVRRLRLAG